MTEFAFEKAANELEEAVFFEDGYYKVVVAKDPKDGGEPNKAMQALNAGKQIDPDGQKPGMNIVLQLRTKHEDPRLNGRSFFVYLPIPTNSDKETISKRDGRSSFDTKLERIYQYASAAMNEPLEDLDPSAIRFEQGQEFFVNIAFRDVDGGLNEIPYNAVPRRLDDEDLLFGGEA